MDSREEFQIRRFALLASAVDVNTSLGLEIGACDLPTVPRGVGSCRFADFRSAAELAERWSLPQKSVCDVNYLISRNYELAQQIPDRFDYVIACHVLEHVPDVIAYINELRNLLRDGGLLFLAVPDKRTTLDLYRPSTTIERLLMSYFEHHRYPSFDQVLEFHRHWVGYSNGTQPQNVREAYDYAKETVESGLADAHCHVWEDHEFRSQFEELADAGFFPGLSLERFEPLLTPNSNEFIVYLRRVKGHVELPPRRGE